MKENITIPYKKVADFCTQWKIKELAFFGSVLRDDFGSESDIDILATFAPDVTWTLFDHVTMQDQLKAIFGRKVDLISRRAIERSPNHLRRNAILNTAESIYVES